MRAAGDATSSIPIVMFSAADPVGDGLIASLAHPGRNITGNCNFGIELMLKRMQLVALVAGNPSAIGYLRGPISEYSASRYRSYETSLGQAAAAMKSHLEVARLLRIEELPSAFAELVGRHINCLMVDNPASFYPPRKQIADLALQHGLPAIGDGSAYAEAGLLLGYGPDIIHLTQRTADFVGRIYRGARAQDLPVELVSRFDLVFNASTASALNVSLPKEVLLQVTKVVR